MSINMWLGVQTLIIMAALWNRQAIIFLPCGFLLSSLLWSPYVIGQTIIFLPCGFYISSFFLAQSQLSEMGCLPYFHTWCGLSANLECMSEMLHAARWKYRTQKIAILAPSHKSVGLYLRSWGMYRQSEKNLLNIDTSSTCPHNMVNFRLLMAEICWRVWGTPSNFNGFRVLAVLLHGTLVVGVSQTLRRWTEAPPIFGRATTTLGIGPHSSIPSITRIIGNFDIHAS